MASGLPYRKYGIKVFLGCEISFDNVDMLRSGEYELVIPQNYRYPGDD